MKKTLKFIKRAVSHSGIFLSLVTANVMANEALMEVNALNYVRAKTAIQFDKYLARAGGKLNMFAHGRQVVGVDARSSKRLNRDTLYSVAIVDISEGASIDLPDMGARYMSVQVVNQDGYTNNIFHSAGRHELNLKEFHTPYVWLLVRTLVVDSVPGDLEAAQKLQDQISIVSASAKTYSHPQYDPVTLAATTDLLAALGKDISDNSKAAGTKEQVDPIKQLLLSAYGFGTLPETQPA